VLLKTADFLNMALSEAFASLSEQRPQSRVRSSMLQLYFEDPRQHYELWLRKRDGLVELGLHFEGEREDSLARVAAVSEAMPLVLGGLGPEVEAEEWTERWTRVHETRPLMPLTEEYAAELGSRLARYVEVLQPIVEGLPPMAPRPAVGSGQGRWGRGRARPRAGAG
jgi:hypothetical protein